MRFAQPWIAFGTVLVMAAGLFACDFTWDGTTDRAWEKGSNWDQPGHGVPGTLGCGCGCCDRALIDICEDSGVLFSNTSGDTFFSSLIDSRMVAAVVLDASANADPVALVVSGDVLWVHRLIMKSGASGEIARLSVKTTNNALRLEWLDITANTASGAAAEIEVEKDLTVGEQTVINGRLNLEISPGAVFDMGRLVCVSCVITSTGVTIPDTCPGS